MQGKTSEMENMREKIKKIRVLVLQVYFYNKHPKKEKTQKWTDKNNSRFPQDRKDMFLDGKGFSRYPYPAQWIHKTYLHEISEQLENILPASREENKTESEHLL